MGIEVRAHVGCPEGKTWSTSQTKTKNEGARETRKQHRGTQKKRQAAVEEQRKKDVR